MQSVILVNSMGEFCYVEGFISHTPTDLQALSYASERPEF